MTCAAGGAIPIPPDQVAWYTLAMQAIGIVFLGRIEVRTLTDRKNGDDWDPRPTFPPHVRIL